MKKILILIAGLPGTGKTHISKQIEKKYPYFSELNFDALKEKAIEEKGYDTVEERAEIIQQSWSQYYLRMEKMMEDGRCIITDYPFSEKQRPIIEKYLKEYHYKCITIRLTGNLDVIYQRQRKRDLSQDRHLSHIMSHYHKGDVLEDRTKADGLLTYKEFCDRCQQRHYDQFQLGELIELDVTDFSKVDYDETLSYLDSLISSL